MNKKVVIFFLFCFVKLLSKQSIPLYKTFDDFIPDEYDEESLKLYPLVKLKKLNDSRLIRMLQNTEIETTRR